LAENLPLTGLKGIIQHWKDDLSAAVSVSLVALPLGLGIAVASGAPPMAGLLPSIIGGIITTLIRGSHVAINGPTASLIVVVLNGVVALGDEDGSGFPYVLAAIVVAGAIQMLLGLFKLGKLGDMFPASVINGMLATIGIIIIIKQFHVALGVEEDAPSILKSIMEMPNSMLNLHPLVTIISILSLLILIFHPKLHLRYIKNIPAPLLVLVVSIPLVFLFNGVFDADTMVMGREAVISQEYLITIPDNIRDAVMLPDFSKVTHPVFWLTVVSILLIASIETLISTKAVDKLDHYKRRTNLNKDLFAVGLSTTISGLLGGLPIITVIVRSSVNINHNAKTRWSNFYHGILLLAYVMIFPSLINNIPQACLAAILLYSGYKLASPKVFRSIALKGWEQMVIMIVTLLASLAIDLLWGVFIGIIVTLVIHWLKSDLNLSTFIRHMVHTEIHVNEESKRVMHVEIKGIANFAILLRLINSFKQLGNGERYVVNFSRTKLVDSTVLDFIHEHREKYFTNKDFEFVGLDAHKTSSSHPLALHVLERPMQKRLSGRQNDLYHFGKHKGYRFNPQINWEIEHFKKFSCFEFHIIEFHRNRMCGTFRDNVQWEISDVTLTDGILMAREEHHITVMVLTFEIPVIEFSITKDNIRQIKNIVRKSETEKPNEDNKDDLGHLLAHNASYYIEGKENQVLIYRKERLLSTKEVIKMHDFAFKFCETMPKGAINP